MDQLEVTEIFTSIQGESHLAGYPCCFIRLTGCNLSCSYCDTGYAMKDGKMMTVDAIVDEARRAAIPLVEVTGGEPLIQPAVRKLLGALVDAGFQVMLETNGSEPLDKIPSQVKVIMDLKTPGSGMENHNLWDNLNLLKPCDEVKFVCVDRADYEWTRNTLVQKGLPEGVAVNISPAWETLAPAHLAQWMLEDRLSARFQIQLHRVLWPERDRGV